MATRVEVSDRVCWAVLAVAMAAATALILYLNRGTTFFLDELEHVYNSPGFDASYLIEPVNGHLGATSKLVYKVVLEAIGADYVAFRILHVLSELVAAGFFYVLVKRRVGAVAALAPTILLLFLGTAYSHVVIPVGLAIFVCIAASLGALLALERGDRRGDVAACVLLVLAMITFTIGLAFLVGVAISVLLREDRWRRAWIFLIPLALYAAWWIWSQTQPGSSGEETELANLVEIPTWIAGSLAAVLSSLAGIQYGDGGGIVGPVGVGRLLAVIAFAALVLRLIRGNVPTTLWVALGVVLSYWCLGAMAEQPGLRSPASLRYMYPGSVMVLLVAAEAARGVTFSRWGLVALFAITAVALVGNVDKLRDGAAGFREYSEATRAQFAAIDLARGTVQPQFNPESAAPQSARVGARAHTYFDVADRYGSLGYSLPELEAQGQEAKYVADQVLAPALELQVEPARGTPTGACKRFIGPTADDIELALPRGGAVIRARSREPAPIAVGRFADVSLEPVGELQPNSASVLRIPTDASRVPWHAQVTEARSVQVCALG